VKIARARQVAGAGGDSSDAFAGGRTVQFKQLFGAF